MLFGGLADSCGKPGLGFARSIAAMRRHASRHRVCANHFSVRATGIPEALCRQVAAIALRRTPPQQGCDHAEVAQRIEPERPPIMTPPRAGPTARLILKPTLLAVTAAASTR